MGQNFGQTSFKLRLKLTHAQRDTLVGDASDYSLDTALCMVRMLQVA